MGDLSETSIPVDFKIEPILIPSATITKLEKYTYGTGGHGDIWKCSMSSQSGTRRVAVKIIRVSQSDDKELLYKAGWIASHQKIRREAYVWIALSHDNILSFEGIVDDFGRLPALVSPWMENGSLNVYLKKVFPKLSDHQKLKLIQQVAAGLSYLHRKDVVHGDLTGTNIFVDDSGNLRLADFGLSMIAAESGNLTFSSLQSGNTRWMAPEFLEPPDDSDEPQSPQKPTKTGDIYSFGCIMLQIHSGEEPYSWIKHAEHVITAIARGREPFKRSVNMNMDEVYKLLSSRCLSKIPEQRPSIVEITTITNPS
ncbi:kinase-like protein [Rhizopogon vinicolor AM-OR11-026]|uniref:Kinase-like protein n=1 Tax=Rhizopogon vinicolor AM-OR11-026 TaxID=1314800 RepID=A0A1B7ML65_9AGAM|nr:kinase-like protein [Rhizopogon vinicolor AM-OR11-026]